MGGLVVGGGQDSVYCTHLGTDKISCEVYRQETNLEVGFQGQ